MKQPLQNRSLLSPWTYLLRVCKDKRPKEEARDFCRWGFLSATSFRNSTSCCWYHPGYQTQPPNEGPPNTAALHPNRAQKAGSYLFPHACSSGGWEQWLGTEVQPWSPETSPEMLVNGNGKGSKQAQRCTSWFRGWNTMKLIYVLVVPPVTVLGNPKYFIG